MRAAANSLVSCRKSNLSISDRSVELEDISVHSAIELTSSFPVLYFGHITDHRKLLSQAVDQLSYDVENIHDNVLFWYAR